MRPIGTGGAPKQMRPNDLRQRAIQRVERGELAVDVRIEVRPDERTVRGGCQWGIGREVLSHLAKRCTHNREYASERAQRYAVRQIPHAIPVFTRRSACKRDCAHISILRVSSLIDGRPARAPLPAEPTLSLSGRPLDARLPLALLEAVKAIDTPEAEFDAELVHELRNKRFGLSETVYQQIRRYSDAVRGRQRVGFNEVLALARLIGRRPDADLAFREAGRRWARSYVGTVSGLRRRAARSLPSLLGRPIALRLLRKLSRRYMGGVLVRQGSILLLEVESPVSADAAPRAAGCGLYEAAFREALLLLADTEGAIEHVMCRARGDRHCQWRAEWRRR